MMRTPISELHNQLTKKFNFHLGERMCLALYFFIMDYKRISRILMFYMGVSIGRKILKYRYGSLSLRGDTLTGQRGMCPEKPAGAIALVYSLAFDIPMAD